MVIKEGFLEIAVCLPELDDRSTHLGETIVHPG